MEWQDVPETVDAWVVKVAAPAFDVRTAATDVITRSPVGYYCAPDGRVGVFAPLATGADSARVKAAVARAVGAETGVAFLSYHDISHPAAIWVKVAYSQTLRRAGELLNFFPGQYPGGVPNAPSPLAAMLTSGLIGAGLGYGGGRLLEATLPEGYGKKLGRTGALLGGAVGMAPGAVWGAANTMTGRGFNDPALLHAAAGADPVIAPHAATGTNQPPQPSDPATDAGSPALEGIRDTFREAYPNAPRAMPAGRHRPFSALPAGPLSPKYAAACEKAAAAFGNPAGPGGMPTDVNIDALGRTLWDSGASPALAATTMGSVYAARQLPDADARPGWVTGQQLGQLAANAAGDFGTGLTVGAVLNQIVGTPYRPPVFGMGAAALGVIGAVVPRLLGR